MEESSITENELYRSEVVKTSGDICYYKNMSQVLQQSNCHSAYDKPQKYLFPDYLLQYGLCHGVLDAL